MNLKIKGVEVLHRGVIYSPGQVICGVTEALAADLMARGCAAPAEGGQGLSEKRPETKAADLGGMKKAEPESLAEFLAADLSGMKKAEPESLAESLAADLSGMKKAELEALAVSVGADLSGARSNTQRAQRIREKLEGRHVMG